MLLKHTPHPWSSGLGVIKEHRNEFKVTDMSQAVKASGTKLDDQSWISEPTWWKERTTSHECPLTSTFSLWNASYPPLHHNKDKQRDVTFEVVMSFSYWQIFLPVFQGQCWNNSCLTVLPTSTWMSHRIKSLGYSSFYQRVPHPLLGENSLVRVMVLNLHHVTL